MPTIADYSIIADGWVVEGVQDTITFEVPPTIDPNSRTVLGFMLEVDNSDDLTLTLRMNGIKIWHWNYPDGSRIRFFQEVIGAGVVRAGRNVFSFDSSSGDVRFVQMSDIVLWWQANI